MREVAPAKFTIKELEGRLRAEFPEMFHTRSGYAIEEIRHGGCRVRKHFHPRSLRPGGTLSGPTMMALADFGIYVAILATVGWVPGAVTTNLNINFLKKPAARDLLGEAHLLPHHHRLGHAAHATISSLTWFIRSNERAF